jgi:hypothetical protein
MTNGTTKWLHQLTRIDHSRVSVIKVTEYAIPVRTSAATELKWNSNQEK